MLLSGDQPSEAGLRGSGYTNLGPGAQGGPGAAPTSRKERWENGGRWMGWVVTGVHGGGVGRRLRLSEHAHQRGRSFRPRCICGFPFLFREWCRNTWLSASQGAGWAKERIGHCSPNTRLPPSPRPHPWTPTAPSPTAHRCPISHSPHQDGKAKPRYAPRVAVNGMADVLEATLERGTSSEWACENATRGWWVMQSHHVPWET